ncbi:MAG: helix-turn-helix domain-containing protein [Chlamydiota bacterium]
MKKRIYHSETRDVQAAETRSRILVSARELFQQEGFECVTIEQLATAAQVSAPTIYALFRSKRGVVCALMKNAFPVDQFEVLVEKGNQAKSMKEYFAITAKIARQINDAERAYMDIFRGAAVLAPELKKLEKEKEELRYKKQEETIKRMVKEKVLAKGLDPSKARAVLWAFTGRDMYRLFVIERGFTSAEYEAWLAELLIKTLLD